MRRALPDSFLRRASGPAIVGHRGVRGAGPENTLASIREAKRQGADAVEIDVRPCRSGEIVVFHDPDLERLAKDPREIAALAFSELRSVDVGGGERIPTLAEALECTSDLGLGLNIEIKHDSPDRPSTVAAVARAVAARRQDHDVMVSSFDPWMLLAHRALAPKLAHALIVHESTYHDWALRVARFGGADGIHTQATITVRARTRWFTEHAFVNCWTINDPGEARRVSQLGVQGIITDRPAEIRAALKR